MKTLSQRISDKIPDRIKVLFCSLDEDEIRFMDAAYENYEKIQDYLTKSKRKNAVIPKFIYECDQDKSSMEFLLARCKNKRFHSYFLEVINAFEYDIRRLLGQY